ncbi:MAG: protein kinase [Planctomycetes bacterium]|nr:protein kinase [Planctomycetota bacterium]
MKNTGRYEILCKIGTGGMADVFLARLRCAQGTEKLLVVKKINSVLAKSTEFMERFVDEARIAMRLNHINIVQVYSFEYIEESYVLSMEYMNGGNLHVLQRRMQWQGHRFSFGISAYIAAEVAKGLDYAHSRSDSRGNPLEIVHRDISPHNILLSGQGAAKIADFGIACARYSTEESGNSIIGKLGYMSPEQAAGQLVDQRSDIYALGIVLYEMLIGRPLVQFQTGKNPLSIIYNKRHPSPRQVDSSVPEPLDRIVSKAISFEPKDRFNSAQEMALALRQFLHSEKEIYDAHTLEDYLRKPLSLVEANRFFDNESIESIKTDSKAIITKENSVSTSATSDTKQDSIVIVSSRIEIKPHSMGYAVQEQIVQLVGEIIKFTADGNLRTTVSDFTVFFDLVDSSMDGAIKAVRLACEVLDEIRALSDDTGLEMNIKLAVARGMMPYQPKGKYVTRYFYSNSELDSIIAGLLGAARPNEILVDEEIFYASRIECNFEDLRLNDGKLAFVISKKDQRRTCPYLNQTTIYQKEQTPKVLTGIPQLKKCRYLPVDKIFLSENLYLDVGTSEDSCRQPHGC